VWLHGSFRNVEVMSAYLHRPSQQELRSARNTRFRVAWGTQRRRASRRPTQDRYRCCKSEEEGNRGRGVHSNSVAARDCRTLEVAKASILTLILGQLAVSLSKAKSSLCFVAPYFAKAPFIQANMNLHRRFLARKSPKIKQVHS